VDRLLLLPLLTPIVLVAAGNDAFGFDPPGYLDAFMYLGYFWHYPEHIPLLDDNYKISRLPWIIPGYLAHAVGGVSTGALVLAFVTLAAGAAALYLLVRDALHDRTIAAVVGVAWAGCTWAHGVGGWNYHMLAAADYYLLACWLLVRAAQGRSANVSALLGGACFAAAVHTHVFYVTFAPLLAILYWVMLPRTARQPLASCARAALLVVAGGIAVTALLGAINRATGGAWLFFMPQVEQAIRLSGGNDRWWLAAVNWAPSAGYLVPPLAFLVAGLFGAGRAWRDGNRSALAFVGLAWGALAIMCYFQFVRRQTTLDYHYMAFALYVHAFPCLAAAMASGKDERPLPWPSAAATAAIVLGALLFLLPEPLPALMDGASAWLGVQAFTPMLLPLAVSVLGVAAMFLSPRRLRAFVFAVWFAVVNAWIAPARAAYGIGTPGIHREMLSLFSDADRFATELDPSLAGIKYWISGGQTSTGEDDVVAGVFDSFVATRTWLTNLLGRKSPGPPIEQLTLADVDRGVCIGVLSSIDAQQRLRREMEERFRALGRPLRHVAERRFQTAELSFALTVLKPVSNADTGRAPCAR